MFFFFSDFLSEAGSHKPFHERSPWGDTRGIREQGGMGGRAGVELRHLKADQHPSQDRFVEIGESMNCQPETVLAEKRARQNVLNPEP